MEALWLISSGEKPLSGHWKGATAVDELREIFLEQIELSGAAEIVGGLRLVQLRWFRVWLPCACALVIVFNSNSRGQFNSI